MKKNIFPYIAIICSFAVIIINLTENNYDVMNMMGIGLGIVVIIVMTILLFLIAKKGDKGTSIKK